MWKILFKDKPTQCGICPLKGSETRECGKIESNKQDSSGMNYIKVPDSRCRFTKYINTIGVKKDHAK